jgi:hypothetical protein
MHPAVVAPEGQHEVCASTALDGRVEVAYIVSGFPQLTETFVLYETRAVEELGVQVEVYLLRERWRSFSTALPGASPPGCAKAALVQTQRRISVCRC